MGAPLFHVRCCPSKHGNHKPPFSGSVNPPPTHLPCSRLRPGALHREKSDLQSLPRLHWVPQLLNAFLLRCKPASLVAESGEPTSVTKLTTPRDRFGAVGCLCSTDRIIRADVSAAKECSHLEFVDHVVTWRRLHQLKELCVTSRSQLGRSCPHASAMGELPVHPVQEFLPKTIHQTQNRRLR